MSEGGPRRSHPFGAAWTLVPISLLVLVVAYVGFAGLERAGLGKDWAPEILGLVRSGWHALTLLVVSGLVSWSLLRQHLPDRTEGQREDLPLPRLLSDSEWLARRSEWFIRIRWIACAVGVAAVSAVLGGELQETAWLLLGCVAFTAAYNTAFLLHLRSQGPSRATLLLQMVADLLTLTVILHAVGGIDRPLASLYLLHVIIANLILSPRRAAGVAALAAALCFGLGLLEASGALPHREGLPLGLEEAMHEGAFSLWAAWAAVVVLLVGGTAYLAGAEARRFRAKQDQLEVAAGVARAEREKLARVLEGARAGLLLLDEHGELVWSSEGIAPWLDEDAPAGGDLQAQASSIRAAAQRALAEGRSIPEEFALPGPEDRLRFYRAIASPLRDPEGGGGRVAAVVLDATASKLLELEVIRSGKLAALGRLAAVVAHEVGNPLSSLHARISRMERSEDEAFLRESLPTLRDQIERIQRIVRGLSRFARPRVEGQDRCDLNALLQEAVEFVRLDPQAAEVELRLELWPEELFTAGTRDELGQVFLNLILNAVHAAGAGGSVTLSSARAEGKLEVLVLDTGPGVGPDSERLFQPFFTTKESGMGLGLAISRTIVRSFGGELRFDEERAEGRCVVSLPAYAEGEGAR